MRPTLAALALWAACSPDGAVTVTRALGPLEPALLSVSIAPDGARWVAGASDSRGALLAVARRDGAGHDTFERLELRTVDPLGGALWWVDASDPAAGVLAVGERGRAFRISGGLPEALPTGAQVTLYGVARAGAEACAVGGPPATLVCLDGDRFEAVPLPGGVESGARLFKITSAPGGFVVVGERGLVLEVGPAAPHSVRVSQVPGRPRLVTVHGQGAGGALVAVGGDAEAYAVELSGAAPRLLQPPAGAPLSGVFVARSTWATGFLGTLLVRESDGWRGVEGLPASFDGHAVAIDRAGVVWVAGGRLLDGAMRQGALWRIGPGAGSEGALLDLDASDTTTDSVSGDAGPEVVTCPSLPPPVGLELGERGLDGCFQRYEDGAALLVVHGPQGGSHVEVALRFPGTAQRVDVALTLSVDGQTVARFEADALPVEADPTGGKLSTDVPVIFAGVDTSPWIGRLAKLEAVAQGGASPLTAVVTVVLAAPL